MHMRHRPKTISKKLDEKAINQKWKKYKTTPLSGAPRELLRHGVKMIIRKMVDHRHQEHHTGLISRSACKVLLFKEAHDLGLKIQMIQKRLCGHMKPKSSSLASTRCGAFGERESQAWKHYTFLLRTGQLHGHLS